MLTLAKYAAILIAAGALLLWIIAQVPPLPEFPPLSEVPAAVVEAPLPADENGRITIEGVVVKGDTTEVPYIEYRQEDGSVRTRQLILAGGRGCSPQAGDLPCADGSSGDQPNVNYSERIRVTGTIKGDQILVTSLERL